MLVLLWFREGLAGMENKVEIAAVGVREMGEMETSTRKLFVKYGRIYERRKTTVKSFCSQNTPKKRQDAPGCKKSGIRIP